MGRPQHARRVSRRVRRRRFVAGTIGILVLAGIGAWIGVTMSGGSRATTTAIRPRHRATAPVAPWTVVATLSGPTAGYSTPDSAAPGQTVSPTWAGTPFALPVVTAEPGWVEVRLVTRPASPRTTWIRSSSASFSRTPYHVVVDLSLMRVLLFESGELVMCAPAGIGTDQHPTPQGHYFEVLLAQPPTAGYGPFVVVTSAVADTVTDWEQSGAPVITIEGPLSTAAAVGDHGAMVTTGSVRLSEGDLAQLRDVPAGSPIDVQQSVRLASTRHNRRTCGDPNI